MIKHFPFSLLVTTVIIILSLYPFGRIELAENVPLADKWTHMVMYAVQSIIIGTEYIRHYGRLSGVRLFGLCLLLPTAVGGLMELAQAYCTNYRSGDWIDLLADAIGAAIGCCLVMLWQIVRKK